MLWSPTTLLRYPLALLALVLFFGGRARAEVPEHNPGLDHTCPPGFQYSRGPAACKQAECPAGAGRTYLYECNCGEAWEKPFRTCREKGLVVKCVPRDQECDMTGKIAGGFFVGLGGFILRSTAQAAAAGSGPIGWGLLFGGAAIGWGIYLWTRGRPGRLTLGSSITGEVLRRVTSSAQRAVNALNQSMRGGLSDEELADLQVVYERWLNLDENQRKQMYDELAREGVDMVTLGDAIRWHRSLPTDQR